jgi:gluconolactonase
MISGVKLVTPFGKGVLKSEGIVVDKDHNVYGCGRNGIVYKVDPAGNTSEVCALGESSIPNGITMDRDGNIVVCDLGRQAVVMVDPSGKQTIFAERAGTVELTLPNFATYDSEGNLYVSNSTTRTIHTVFDELTDPGPNGALVRFRPDGRGEVVATGIWFANGVSIDPQEQAVYVLESTRRDCLRIEIRKDGSFGKPEVYASGFPGEPDGMAFAADGTLIVTVPAWHDKTKLPGASRIIAVEPGGRWTLSAANRIISVDTQGHWTTFIDGPEDNQLDFPTNCAFGGPGFQDLYFSNLEGDHFSRVNTDWRGHPLYHQR